MLRKFRVSAAWAMSTARAYISGEGRADGDCISRNVPNLMVMSPSPRRSERGMGKPGRLHAKRVHGGPRGEKERPEIRPAESQIGGHAVRLVRGHVGKDPPPDHAPRRVQLEDVDVLGPASVGHV